MGTYLGLAGTFPPSVRTYLTQQRRKGGCTSTKNDSTGQVAQGGWNGYKLEAVFSGMCARAGGSIWKKYPEERIPDFSHLPGHKTSLAGEGS